MTQAEKVVLPEDLQRALRAAAGAREAFRQLAPSHQRELLRYLNAARSVAGRKKRIGEAIDQALGRTPEKNRGQTQKPLWICPDCGSPFVNRNQSHSCQRHTIEDVFKGKPAHIRVLFERFREIVESFGPVITVPYRNRIGFMARVRFAGGEPTQRFMEIRFWLDRRLESPRFHKVETITPRAHIYWLRITQLEQFDPEVIGWLRAAYSVGCQEHLVSSGKKG
jgi:hypothetical protein